MAHRLNDTAPVRIFAARATGATLRVIAQEHGINELARLQQAAEVFATWAPDAHRYTLKGALSIVKTEAARRGLI